MNILEKIVADKRIEVKQELAHINDDLIYRTEDDKRTPYSFLNALKVDGLSVIAEVKKASPSKGVIREDFDPVAIAKEYEAHGATCLSVLTEKKYFQGHPDYLKEIRKQVNIPLLKKDFFIDPRQIREAYDLGADAILLIVSCLKKQELEYYYEIASSYGLTCLAEVHSEEEVKIALECNFELIGINNRDLSTFV
ncbi:MAG: indole-3-glycerol phosphate synthase, partial [bacterium]